MKKIFLAILLLIGVIYVTPAEASKFSDWWDSTWLGSSMVGQALGGIADLTYRTTMSVARMAGCTISSGLCPTGTSFMQRLQNYQENSCWFCGVFGDVFDTMNEIVSQLCISLKNKSLTLLGLGFLFWLLFRIGKVVIDITPDSGDAKMVPDILKQTIRVSIASLMIIFYLDVFDYIITPPLRMAIGLGQEISGQALQGYIEMGSRAEEEMNKKLPKEKQVRLGFDTLCAADEMSKRTDAGVSSGEFRGQGTGDGSDKVFTNFDRDAYLCYLKTGSASLITGMAIGSTAIHGWSDMPLLQKLGHMQLPIIGLEIYLSFFLLFIAFPLKLFDPLVNLMFVSALFPLWVVLWAFEGTKKYSQKAIDILIGVGVHLVVISVMTVIVIQIMGNALGSADERNQLYADLMMGKRPEAVFEGIGETNVTGAVAGAAAAGAAGLAFGLVGRATMMTVALGFFAFQLFRKTKEIANKFEGLFEFGAGEAAQTLGGGAMNKLTNAGASTVSAGYHASRMRTSQEPASGGQDTRPASGLRTFRQTMGAIAGGGLFGAARRFNQIQTPENHTGTGTVRDSLRTSLLGRTVGRLFGVKSWARETDNAGNVWRMDTKTGINTRTAHDGSYERYDRNNQTYVERDKRGQTLSSYNYRTQEVSLGNQKYQKNAAGEYVDAQTNAAVDDVTKQKINDAKQKAELRKQEFENKTAANGLV